MPFKAELFKLFIKRRFLLIMLGLILYTGIRTVIVLENSYALRGADLETYKGYIGTFAGEITEEKIDDYNSLCEIYDHLYDLQQQLLAQSAFDGESAKKREMLDGVNRMIETKQGFNLFSERFQSAMLGDQPLCDVIPWNILLAERIDAVYVFAVIVGVLLISVNDSASGMNYIRFATKRGKLRLQLTDVILCLLLTVLFGVLLLGVKWLSVDVVYGIDYPDYPIASIDLFTFSIKNISLGRCFWISGAVKIIGYVYLGGICYLLGAIFKSAVNVVFPALISVFLPAYILQYRRILYLLPFPTGPLLTNGYYMNVDASTGLRFSDIPVKSCVVFLGSLVLTGILFYMIGGAVNLRRNRL